MIRYTDQDCLAAMIRAASHLGIAVVLPESKYRAKLRDVASAYGVTVAGYSAEIDRLALDHAPGCYGGGVRPMLMEAGCTGHSTPRWWTPSAGLGPGAVPRKEFCHILSAVEGALANREEAKEVGGK